METDISQYGLQEGIQIEQVSLRVAALLRKGIQYILVLDLAKAYDTVLRRLLLEKLKRRVLRNLVNQLRVFLSTVVDRVAGDITNTRIPMKRGLTQGGTSPPKFKLFINDLPEGLSKVLREEFPN